MTGISTPISKIFIDTGAFIAITHADDALHSEAVAFFQALPPHVSRMTTPAVIGETYTFLRYHVGQQAALSWLDVLEKALASGYLKGVDPDAETHRAARLTLRRFADQELSYTDALTLAVLESEKIECVFGFDHHLALTGRTLLPGPYRRRV